MRVENGIDYTIEHQIPLLYLLVIN